MTLADRLQGQPFQGYAYSYPHKMAYRPLRPALPLAPLWAAEDRDSLFLYVHIPFCEMRCGFCNLFTTANPEEDLVSAYLSALERQMIAARDFLGPHRFARAAFGGGTPTFLSPHELERMFDLIDQHLGRLSGGIPISLEMSPGTVSPEKMRLLRERGVTRASIGVQSFVPAELKALGRPQDLGEVRQALTLMRQAGFAILNLDLIYGAPGQSIGQWEFSLREALHFAPEEIYLYPLYIRPLTGLERLGREPSDLRPELYRHGRDFLLEHGYEQISMRLFRRHGVATEHGAEPFYCCQEDGMLGLGAGARSYTDEVHYSSEYAVRRPGVREIIDAFLQQTPEQMAQAEYGCVLDEQEQRRRFVIKSLLRSSGLGVAEYASRFEADLWTDFPQLLELLEFGLAGLSSDNHRLLLTPAGLERSDTIGPWLFSSHMESRMDTYALA